MRTPTRQYGVAAVVAFICLSCGKSTTWDNPGPRETFELYLFDLFRGDAEKAFLRIDPEDRVSLLKSREQLKLPPDAMPADHEMLVIAGVDVPYDIKRMSLEIPLERAPEAGQLAVIRLHYRDGHEGKAVMKWGGEHWFVDLPLDTKREQ